MCVCVRDVTLTGGVEAAFTTKETFLEEECAGLPARSCLAASTEEVMDEDESRACVAISYFSLYQNQQLSAEEKRKEEW